MRITGGEFCGRNLLVPKSDEIRPTQDRVREALFNIIQFEVPGSDFLDLFSGSGAVGIEALSRGAASVTFVEQNRRHVAVLERNLAGLRPPAAVDCNRAQSSAAERSREQSIAVERPTVAVADAYRWLERYAGPGFSIAFADPPDALGEERGYAQVLARLAERGVVRPNGLFIAEMTAVQKAEETPGWELVRDRTYGKTRLCLWRREKASEATSGKEDSNGG